MKIYQCKEITEEILQAFNKLIPQLSNNCEIPSQNYLEEIIQSKNSFLFLAKDESIVGSLTLVINQIPTCKKAWIEDVVVDKDSREKGIGKRLIEFAIEFAKNKDILKIDLTSRPERVAANELYKKLGFVKRNTNIYRLEL